MIRILDNTLMAQYNFIRFGDDIYRFCELLFLIGIDAIELPVRLYEEIGRFPPGKYVLNVSCEEEAKFYPGFYRYVSQQEMKSEQSIMELQLNDIREIIRLKNYQNKKEVRIVGLDDLMCHSYEKIIPEIISSLSNSIIIFSPENTYGCASALAVEWLLVYGRDVTTSFAGCMNNAATEEVLMTLRLAVRHKPNRDLTVLPEITALYEQFSQKPVGNRKAIIGKNIFKVEAGIHADGLNKNPMTYEAFSPRCVGGKSELVIGKHSGTRAIKIKMEQLNLPVPEDEAVEQIMDCVRQVCTKYRKSLTDEEFIQILREKLCLHNMN